MQQIHHDQTVTKMLTEIAQQREKTHAPMQAMMQELLTGGTRQL